MNWFVPSWFGDMRLKPSPEDPKRTVLVCDDLTPDEREQLKVVMQAFVEKGWVKKRAAQEPKDAAATIRIDASIEEVGPVFVSILRPGPGVLTAVRLHDGRVEVCEHRGTGVSQEVLAELAQKEPEAAVTVRRPTPSCPMCFVDSCEPATEVLLAFLNEEQHRTWSEHRYIVTRGNLTGHHYILAHRHSEIAAKNGRICFDATDADVLHFHDWSVPPEEEILASMICLSKREPWLRNQATCLGPRFTRVFDNPFGDHLEGVADTALTRMVGLLGHMLVDPGPPPPPAPKVMICRIDPSVS